MRRIGFCPEGGGNESHTIGVMVSVNGDTSESVLGSGGRDI